MEALQENGLENQQERLAKAVTQFLRMLNRPDRMASDIEIIIKGLGAPQLPAAAQGSMDKLVSRLRVLLPKEDQDIDKEEIENMIRAILEEGHI